MDGSGLPRLSCPRLSSPSPGFGFALAGLVPRRRTGLSGSLLVVGAGGRRRRRRRGKKMSKEFLPFSSRSVFLSVILVECCYGEKKTVGPGEKSSDVALGYAGVWVSAAPWNLCRKQESASRAQEHITATAKVARSRKEKLEWSRIRIPKKTLQPHPRSVKMHIIRPQTLNVYLWE